MMPDDFATECVEKFWSKVRRGAADECWPWTAGSTQRGYGVLYARGSRDSHWLAHRYSYTLHNGAIPPGLCVCHSCDNPPCVNPAHLWVGTRRQNSQDMIDKGRNVLPAISEGERSHFARLRRKQVIEIRRRAEAGETNSALAREFGVTRRTVDRVVNGQTWKHLPGAPDPSLRHRGPRLGQANRNAKLSDDQVLEVFRRAVAGEQYAELAYEFGVSKSLVWMIANRRVRARLWKSEP